MLIFSRAQVPTYRRSRAGDASDGQMHSTVFMMRWHFCNRLLAAVFCGWSQLNRRGFDSARVSRNVANSAVKRRSSVAPKIRTNLKTCSFSCLMQTYSLCCCSQIYKLKPPAMFTDVIGSCDAFSFGLTFPDPLLLVL